MWLTCYANKKSDVSSATFSLSVSGGLLFQGGEDAFGAGADAFVATDAGVGVDDFDVTVAEEVDFSEDLLGTGGDAVPTGDAIVGVDGNKRSCHALFEF